MQEINDQALTQAMRERETMRELRRNGYSERPTWIELAVFSVGALLFLAFCLRACGVSP